MWNGYAIASSYDTISFRPFKVSMQHMKAKLQTFLLKATRLHFIANIRNTLKFQRFAIVHLYVHWIIYIIFILLIE